MWSVLSCAELRLTAQKSTREAYDSRGVNLYSLCCSETFQEKQPCVLTFRFCESLFVLDLREVDWSITQAHMWQFLYVLSKCI